jgi:tripartite-type tricarboxylate transporter receptor subunit TctC
MRIFGSPSIRSLLIVMSAWSIPGAAMAAYPEKPVRIVVGFAAGGPTDVVARLVAERLAQRTGQPFIVDNKPGAASMIAATEVARAAADGYTLLMTGTNHATSPAVLPKIPFDTLKSFAAVMLVAEGPHVLVVNVQSPFNSVKEVVTFAKAHPKDITYSSSGRGGTVHFAGAMFEEAAKVELTHVPYKGAAPAVQDLLAGQVQMSFATLASVSSHVRSGRLKVLAIAADKRIPEFASVPTFAELGYPSVTIAAWAGLLAPAATPRPVLEKLAGEMREILTMPEVLQRLQSQGMTPGGTSLTDFDARIAREVSAYGRIAKERSIIADE